MPDPSPSVGTWREHHPLRFDYEYVQQCRRAREMLQKELRQLVETVSQRPNS